MITLSLIRQRALSNLPAVVDCH